MTEEAQIRALAKLDGITAELHNVTGRGWVYAYVEQNGASRCLIEARVPNYLNDLNALHKIEETLTDDELIRWERILVDIVQPLSLFRGTDGYAHVMAQVHRASARQRAEALVRVKGLWND
jgi:hypothetical protein